MTDMIQHPSGLKVKFNPSNKLKVKKPPQTCLIQFCCSGDIRHGYPQTDIQTSTAHFQKRTEVMGKGDVKNVVAFYNTLKTFDFE